MAKKYDVIVIGAGLGGLTAATRLARKGLSVLLLERHNIPGGYATSFVRGRYEFEIALHELSGIGPPEKRSAFFRFLEDLGVAERVELVQIDHLYRSVYPDMDITLPHGTEAYTQTLVDAFPHEEDGLRRFLDIIWGLEREVVSLEEQLLRGSLSIPKVAALPAKIPNVIKYLPATWGDVLRTFVRDPKARAVLSQYWGYFGLPPSRCSFFYFALGLAGYVKKGASFPRGRSQALSNAFVSAFESWGGELRLGCGVKRITHGSGRVTGVVTESGDHFMTDRIVSNVGPINLAHDLIGIDAVPARWLRGLKRSEIGLSSVNVYLGVNRSPEELGVTEHEFFLNRDYDADDHYDRMCNLRAPGGMVAACYNQVIPDVSPPGTSLFTLTTLSSGKAWRDVPPEKYVEVKTRIAEGMLDMTEKVLPDLRRYAEVVEVATPLTCMRYSGNIDGAIYGFANHPWDHTVLRLGQKGPLDGMYLAGAWTQPGGGFQPSMSSGQTAAALILKDIRKSGGGAR
jgi:phytoene dehydrogenase-like protein